MEEQNILPNGYSYRGRDFVYHVVTHFVDNGELYYVVKYRGMKYGGTHYEVQSVDDVEHEKSLYKKRQEILKNKNIK